MGTGLPARQSTPQRQVVGCQIPQPKLSMENQRLAVRLCRRLGRRKLRWDQESTQKTSIAVVVPENHPKCMCQACCTTHLTKDPRSRWTERRCILDVLERAPASKQQGAAKQTAHQELKRPAASTSPKSLGSCSLPREWEEVCRVLQRIQQSHVRA